jgi:diaminopimelate decarboxylase
MVHIDYSQLAEKYGTPLYVYDSKQIEDNIRRIARSLKYRHSTMYFAVMCNNHKNILSVIRRNGLGVQINSVHELQLVKKAGFKNSAISFTSTGISTDLMKTLIREGIRINLDSVEEVDKFCTLAQNRKFGVRIRIPKSISARSLQATNTNRHSHIGIEEKDFKSVLKMADAARNSITGVHGYFASNVLEMTPFQHYAPYMCTMASSFPDLEYVNFGSGFGIPYAPGQKAFDIKKVLALYALHVKALSHKYDRPIELIIEPGRTILADAGSLLVQITNIKRLNSNKYEIAIDAGYAELARPLLYGSYHAITTVNTTHRQPVNYDIRGNTVLQNDFLGKNRMLEKVREGDYLLIRKVGAYGAVMASGFPGKEIPKQLFL